MLVRGVPNCVKTLSSISIPDLHRFWGLCGESSSVQREGDVSDIFCSLYPPLLQRAGPGIFISLHLLYCIRRSGAKVSGSTEAYGGRSHKCPYFIIKKMIQMQ
jgi:hypothetical protein